MEYLSGRRPCESLCWVFFFFSPLFFLSFFLACLSSPLFAPILFLSIPSRYERPDSPTPAPISPVEANYWSQVVEGLKRSFFLIFFFFFFSTTTTAATHLPQARTLDAHQVWQCHRGAVCGDKIWTEVLLGKAFYQPGLACTRAQMKNRAAICTRLCELSLVQQTPFVVRECLPCPSPAPTPPTPLGCDQSQIASVSLPKSYWQISF